MNSQGAKTNPLRQDLGGVAAYLAAGGMCSAPEAMRMPLRDALMLSVRLQHRQQLEHEAHRKALAAAKRKR